MEDIYDIKGPINYFFIELDSIVYTIWFILMSIFFYLLYYYFAIRNNEEYRKKQTINKKKKELDILFKKLSNLKNLLDHSRWEFYPLLNNLVRSYLEYRWYKFASKYTYKELKNIIKQEKLLILARESYFIEYDDKMPENNNMREDFIDKIDAILKNEEKKFLSL